MSIDLSTLTAEELDQLLREWVQERAKRDPRPFVEQPNPQFVCQDPAWRGVPTGDAVDLFFCDLLYGWVGFQIPGRELSNLATFLLRCSLDFAANAGKRDKDAPAPAATTPTPSAGGGRTIH